MSSIPMSESDQPSVLFCTHHKCASTFISKLLNSLNNIKGLRTIDYEQRLWEFENSQQMLIRYDSNSTNFFNEVSHILYQDKNFLYGPLRVPINIMYDPRFTRIIFLRDPRDALVSLYYSISYSHPFPSNESQATVQLSNDRNLALSQGINEFVLDKAIVWLKPILTAYREIIETSESNVHFFLYEDFIQNPAKIIHNIINIIVNQSLPELIKEILNNEKFIQEKICYGQHQRSGKIGQYHNELHPLTVEKLNRLFQNELQFFGWNNY
jgi:hypothetical protein